MSIPSWCRQRRFAAAGLVLYAALAVAVMSPFASREVPSTPAQDLCNHVSGIIEARHALAEGQFPIRIAPHQNQQTRYAIFQFYGNLPYTLGGAAYLLTRVSPYTIWKLEIGVFLVLGAFFTYRCGRMLTRQPLPALAAGAVFLTAPYVLTDLHGRFAFSEVVSFMLLPVVFYWSLRCFVARRLGPILASGAAWSALVLSHNITFLYAAAYFGLFFLTLLLPQGVRPRLHWLPNRKQWSRGLRVGAGFALGMVLTLWSIVPQQLLVPKLSEGFYRGDVINSGWLTPLGVLLAPGVVLPVHLPTIYIGTPEHFGLQVGWPILAAVALTLCYLRSPLAGLHGRRALAARFLFFFALTFLMVWMPVNYWPALPELFNFVQFTYRLLMFIVLWGALLAAYALALGFEGRMRPIHLAGIVLGLGFTTGPYLAPHKTEPHITLAQEIAHPEMGRGGAGAVFAIAAERLAETTLLHPDMDWAAEATGGLLDGLEFTHKGRWHAIFPGSSGGDAIEIAGTVSSEIQKVLRIDVSADGVLLAAPELPPGPFQLTIPLPATPMKSRIRVTVEGEPILTPAPPPHPRPFQKPSFSLTRLSLVPKSGRPAASQLITAEAVRSQVKFGHPTTLRIETAEPSLVQLPVVYYPGMHVVKVDGQAVPVQHLGRFVAVELPAGKHAVAVRFVGVPWASAVSLAAWIAVAVAAFVLSIRRLKRLRGTRTGKPRPHFALRLTDAAIRAFGRSSRAERTTEHSLPSS